MKFVLDQVPTSKKRQRYSRKTGKFYNPSFPDETKTRWEMISQINEKAIYKPSTRPIEVEMYFGTPFPKSFKHGPENENLKIPDTSHPDVDNLVKFYMDVMNRLIYHDDRQVWNLYAEKKYSNIPKVEIKVEEQDENKSILHVKINSQIFNKINSLKSQLGNLTLSMIIEQALEQYLTKNGR